MKYVKHFLAMALAVCLMCGLLPTAAAAAPAGRETVSLNGEWTFTDHTGAQSTVRVPHSWEFMANSPNPADSIRTAVYERTVSVGAFAGKRLFLQFDGVNKEAVVYIDGAEVGGHTGGFTAFALDITDACRGKDQVLVRVEVTNITTDTMPMNTDFTHFAGIYRDVRLAAVDSRAYLALEDHGSQGVYLASQVDLASGRAVLTPTVLVSSPDGGRVTVQTTLKDARGCVVGTACEIVTLPAGTVAGEVTLKPIAVNNARLWQGTEDPYLYTAETTLCVKGRQVDSNTQRVGFRTFEVRDGAFYLNGRAYGLRGVGMHQEYGAVTNVTTREQRDRDLQLVLEMGANALRTCHYPHDQSLYDLCDEYGIVVWNEIPFYLLMQDTEVFRANALETAAEMVKQGYNHPSILVWGVANEVNDYSGSQGSDYGYDYGYGYGYGYGYDYGYGASGDPGRGTAAGSLIQELARLVKDLDPSRLVAEAVIDSTALAQQTAGWTTADAGLDVVGLNMYPGWYSGVSGADRENQLERITDVFRNKLRSYQGIFNQSSGGSVSYVLSEYGAGGNIAQHADLGADFRWNGAESSRGQFHPEEYQSYVHEAMLMGIYGDETNGVAPAENLWCAFAWAMFDFSTYRNEGGQPRLNTKGLVTADRSVKKDAFYLYKANWNQTEPFVHITSGRYTDRPGQTIDVKVYSNCETVELTVNGVSYGAGTKQQDGVFVWEGVMLNGPGQSNQVLAAGVLNGAACTDTCDGWVFSGPGA